MNDEKLKKLLDVCRTDFAHLHCHTMKGSMRDAIPTAKDLVNAAFHYHQRAVAVTDHGYMHSVMDALHAQQDLSEALLKKYSDKIPEGVFSAIKKMIPERMILRDAVRNNPEAFCPLVDQYYDFFVNVCYREVKVIMGLEAYVLPSLSMLDDENTKHTKNHLILLAKNVKGRHLIEKAATKAELLKDKGAYPRMTHSDIQNFFGGENAGNVICLSACVQGEIPQLLALGKKEEAKKTAKFYTSVFKGDFYIEIQDHHLAIEDNVREPLRDLAKELSIKTVCTNDVHYISKEEAFVRDMIVAMRFAKKVTDTDFEKDCQELYFKSQNEMEELFPKEEILMTGQIADQCDMLWDKYEKHHPKAINPGNMTDDEALWTKVREGFKKYHRINHYSKEKIEVIKKRINYEMGVISKLHYSGYLLIVSDFISYAKKHGLVGPGRGSAVGSLVCYYADITSVDPLEHQLIFERFLNEERVSDPDIDTDFAPSIRESVIDYVKDVYGENAVCQIATFGTLGAKSSIRQGGRVLGIDIATCEKIAKMIPSDIGITIQEAIEKNPELKKALEDKTIHYLVTNAQKLEGLIVQKGVHAAGVIISDRDVSDYVALTYNDSKEVWVTSVDKDSCEYDLGCLKMDFLGLENLNVIQNAFDSIKESRNLELTLGSIDIYNTEETDVVIKNIFASGNTNGVFQFESEGMKQMLRRFHPTSFEDLILLNAAYRPGPMQYLPDIIQVKKGEAEPKYICDGFSSILDATYGKPIYQEQIQQIFHEIAGFSLGEADIIRRAMAKKKTKELVKYLPKFKEALLNKGAAKKDIEQFCDELMDFAKYAFNKSHATAYAVVAYQTAWLKYYFPTEYMAALLTSTITNSNSSSLMPLYIEECKKMDIEVLPPDINRSDVDFKATNDRKIYYSLKVKNVGKAAEDIVQARGNVPFASIYDFVDKLAQIESKALHKRAFESLSYTGAFHCFGLTRKALCDEGVDYIAASKNFRKIESEMQKKKVAIHKVAVELREAKDNFYHNLANQMSLHADELYEKCVAYQKGLNSFLKKKAKWTQKTKDTVKEKAYQSLNAPFGVIESSDRDMLLCDCVNYIEIYKKYLATKRMAPKNETYLQKKEALELQFSTEEFPKELIYEKEKEILGFYVSGHPLEDEEELLIHSSDYRIANVMIDGSFADRHVKLAGRIADYQVLYRKKDNRPMCRFSLEDLTGKINVICFTESYDRYKDLIKDGKLVSMDATIMMEMESDENGMFTVSDVQCSLNKIEEITRTSSYYITVKDVNDFKELLPTLHEFPGKDSLYVYREDKGILQKWGKTIKKCKKLQESIDEHLLMKKES